MATLKATRLREALQKARNVGVVEEPVMIAGCELVFQNLPSEAYEAIMAECAELEDVEYYNAYQIGHICRAIVEIDGTDLRDVDFIEDEVPDPKNPDQLITRKFERHAWVRQNIISTWGREAVAVAWRKFAETLVKADELAKAGVQFIIPDETAESRYRRLLAETMETEQDLPGELVEKILNDAGYIKRSSLHNLDRLEDRAEQLKRIDDLEKATAEASQGPSEPSLADEEPEPPPAPVAAPEPPRAPQATPPAGAPPEKIARPLPTGDPREMMRSRTPLNRQAGGVPVPGASEHNPTAARPRVKVPDQIRRAAMQNTADVTGEVPQAGVPGVLSAPRVEPEIPPPGSRASHIAALESQALGNIVDHQAQEAPSPAARPEAVPEVRHQRGINPREVAAITEKGPVVGRNKKWNPPPRQP